MAFTMSRGSPGTPPHTPGHGLPVFLACCCPRLPFQGRVSHQIQRHLLSSLPAARAIHQCTSWRTDYYGGSATPGCRQPTAGLPAAVLAARREGRHPGASHVHDVPVGGGGGAQLFPGSLATPTPQPFSVAFVPA